VVITSSITNEAGDKRGGRYVHDVVHIEVK
jgi:hypothetical protein